MKMRGSIPDRKSKMSLEEYRAMKARLVAEKAKHANVESKQQTSGEEWVEARVVFGAGQPIPDEVPQSTGD